MVSKEIIKSHSHHSYNMNEAFEQFKSTAGSLAEDTMKEAPKRFDGWICSQDIGA
jgi:hypothetical protein